MILKRVPLGKLDTAETQKLRLLHPRGDGALRHQVTSVVSQSAYVGEEDAVEGSVSFHVCGLELMAFLGLVPSEHSTGTRRRQGGITRTGNAHARRMLVESAWSYRFPARQTKHLKGKACNASPVAKQIAWKAQVRLCGRYRTLSRAGKDTKLVCVAIARELAGFLWDIVRQEMPRLAPQQG
jgi:transposase